MKFYNLGHKTFETDFNFKFHHSGFCSSKTTISNSKTTISGQDHSKLGTDK